MINHDRYLNNNQLSGTIPSTIGNLSRLGVLYATILQIHIMNPIMGFPL